MRILTATPVLLVALNLMLGCSRTSGQTFETVHAPRNAPSFRSGTIEAFAVDEVIQGPNPDTYTIRLNNHGSTPIVINRAFDDRARPLQPVTVTKRGLVPSAHTLPVSVAGDSSVTFAVPEPQQFIIVETEQGRFKWTSAKGWTPASR